MPAGRYEALPTPGRRQNFVSDINNLSLQDPSAFIQNTNVKVYQPFILAYETGSEVASGQINTDIFTVPTGFKMRVLDAWAIARSAESSCTVQFRNNTTAIFTAVAAATDEAVARAAAGFSDAAYDLTAGQKLNVLTAGGTNAAALNIYALCALSPA